MNRKADLSDNELYSLKYWQAVVAFGATAVENTVNESRWIEIFPEIFDKLRSDNMLYKRDVILPGDIIYEIAGREECVDDYFADRDEERLYAIDKQKKVSYKPDLSDCVYIPTQEALIDYGATCLFEASDKGVGYRGERDTLRFPHLRRYLSD